MDFSLLLKCITIGFSISSPIGPIDLLCVHNTLSKGIKAGLATALGAATADLIYVVLITLGMHSIATFLLTYQTMLTIVGSVFLCYLGVATIKAKPEIRTAYISHGTLLKTYLLTFFLKLINPVTIVDFMALFTSLHIDATGYHQSLQFIIGISLGCTTWWLFLWSIVSLFHKKISAHQLQWLNYVAGTAILLFGIWSLVKLI